MKIGIMTYWKSSCNYGEQLQNYALQEYLRELGHEAFLIRYDYDNDRIRRPLHKKIEMLINPRKMAGYIEVVKNGRKLMKEGVIHPRGFEEFRQKNLSFSRVYSSIGDLRNDPPEADMYLTGSDQVWNSFGSGLSEMRNRLSAFFLDFGDDEVIRVSYAASWGRNEVSEEEADFIRPLLKRFAAISVRERSGIDICRNLGRDDSGQAVDPVMLFGPEKYRGLYLSNGVKPSNERYVLFYYMNHDGAYDRQTVFDWADSMGLKVKYVTDDWHDDFPRLFPSVYEWLNLLDNAEYVVTNSYHCSLLSILFRKRFGVIRRFGIHTGMNTRLDSLFELCGIEPRYIDDYNYDVLNRAIQEPDEEMINKTWHPDMIVGMVERV